MAHFAQLDKDNKVINVVCVNNADILLPNGKEDETMGISFLKSIFGTNTNWVQTSYNSTRRGRFASVGMWYNPTLDCFVNDPHDISDNSPPSRTIHEIV